MPRSKQETMEVETKQVDRFKRANLHNPKYQLDLIQQILSQNVKPLGFFIGAGCPLSIRIENTAGEMEALIGDVAGLTKSISFLLEQSDASLLKSWNKLKRAIEEDKEATTNIETILTKIRLLKEVAGSGLVRGLNHSELTDLDSHICFSIADQVNKQLPIENTAFHDLAIWTRATNRNKPVQIFTTNYDLLLEQAFEESSAPYFDGFVGSRQAFFDLAAVEQEWLLPARWTRLWKIHGSLNWRVTPGKQVARCENQPSGEDSYLIYPSHLKYDQSRKMPFIAMLDRLKSFLMTPSSTLFICGYSFGDEHINDIICRTLEANSSAHVFAFAYGDIADDRYIAAKRCAMSTPNCTLLGKNSGVIGRNDYVWTGDVVLDLSIPRDVLTLDSEGKPELHLGDFAMLGKLLRSLTGWELEQE